MPGSRVDPAVIAAVLDGVLYPARSWQLLAQADHYGVSRELRATLNGLPDGVYRDAQAVVAELERIAGT